METKHISIDTSQIIYQVMKSPKKGGQHVNTTCSGVRAIYKPLGIKALSYDQRSQHHNRQIAKERLLQKLKKLSSTQAIQQQTKLWKIGKQVPRGNPIKIFKTERFEEVK
jgi:peptide chain release factor